MLRPRLTAAVRRLAPASALWRRASPRLYWWHGAEDNFGDAVSPMLISSLFGLEVKHSKIETCDLIAIGSVLDIAQRATLASRPHVWGSGFISPGEDWKDAPLRVHAVRGELSALRLGMTPEKVALGDPGILLARAFPRDTSRPQNAISVIPHYTEYSALRTECERLLPSAQVIDLTGPVTDVLDAISSSEYVLSSSLHGLVAADAYGIPNSWITPGPLIMGHRYKFDDYYSAFSVRRDPEDLHTILASWESRRDDWKPLPRLAERQDQLVEAFPGPHV